MERVVLACERDEEGKKGNVPEFLCERILTSTSVRVIDKIYNKKKN